MHQEIFSAEQQQVLPFVGQFRREFYLAGGTAVALYLGYRRVIDFDLFKQKGLRPTAILQKITAMGLRYQVLLNKPEQLDVMLNEVKFTFFQYPFAVTPAATCNNLRLPSLAHLAAMKAYALGRRTKWKDYVDLFFLLKDHFTVEQIALNATAIFGDLFSEKLFRAQLCYFNDIDYTEPHRKGTLLRSCCGFFGFVACERMVFL